MVTTYSPTIDEVKGDRDWSALEQDLLDECRLGRTAYLPGKEDCPEDQSDPDRRVRAGLIRYLLLGGCEGPDGYRPHPSGVLLRGAWIDGDLDCDDCISYLDVGLYDCLFENRVSFGDAEIGALHLSGSRAKRGLNLHRLRTEADLFLRGGFHATGLVDLGGAEVGTQLDCTKGRFDGGSGKALHCQGIKIGNDIFLRGGVQSTGLVNLRGAEIGGQLDCDNGTFDGGDGRALHCEGVKVVGDVFLREGFHATGEVRFLMAHIEGAFQAANAEFDDLLNLHAARIDVILALREIQGKHPVLDLSKVRVGVLQDDLTAWEAAEGFDISGFAYDRIKSLMGVQDRLDWLNRKWERSLPEDLATALSHQPWWGRDLQNFDPQPYTQLAKVFDAEGNRSGAARVLAVREDKIRQAEQSRAFGRLDGSVKAGFTSLGAFVRQVWNAIFKWVFGYGHRPARALLWVLGFWVYGWMLSHFAFVSGQMAPNSDVILTSKDWLDGVQAYLRCLHDGIAPPGECVSPLQAWLETPAARDYETFSSFLYALDLFVPLDALGQESSWAPTTSYGVWGKIAYWSRMPIQMAGWVITAVGAAVLTGLIGKKE